MSNGVLLRRLCSWGRLASVLFCFSSLFATACDNISFVNVVSLGATQLRNTGNGFTREIEQDDSTALVHTVIMVFVRRDQPTSQYKGLISLTREEFAGMARPYKMRGNHGVLTAQFVYDCRRGMRRASM